MILKTMQKTRLNPFEIRAGQKHGFQKPFKRQWSLNPFEIRAGQKQKIVEQVLVTAS